MVAFLLNSCNISEEDVEKLSQCDASRSNELECGASGRPNILEEERRTWRSLAVREATPNKSRMAGSKGQTLYYIGRPAHFEGAGSTSVLACSCHPDCQGDSHCDSI